MRSLLIALLICLSYAPSIVKADPCQGDTVEFDSACWDLDALHDYFDDNTRHNEEAMSDFTLEEFNTTWADEELKLRHEN